MHDFPSTVEVVAQELSSRDSSCHRSVELSRSSGAPQGGTFHLIETSTSDVARPAHSSDQLEGAAGTRGPPAATRRGSLRHKICGVHRAQISYCGSLRRDLRPPDSSVDWEQNGFGPSHHVASSSTKITWTPQLSRSLPGIPQVPAREIDSHRDYDASEIFQCRPPESHCAP